MNKHTVMAVVPMAVILMQTHIVSCTQTNNGHTAEIDSTECTIEMPKGIQRTDTRTIRDTIMVRGKQYLYTFTIQSNDTLPPITNAEGMQYYENTVTLTIRQGGNNVFNRTFTKHSFDQFVPSGKMHVFTLIGFNYNLNRINEHNFLSFIASVGDPDDTSELYYPVEITIHPDGHCTMQPAENIETEPLEPGLSIEPSNEV